MNGMRAALYVEWLKMRRSKVLWLSAIIISVMPLAGGMFMLILKDPDGARRLGIIATKAEITAGTADWPSYLSLLAQMAGIIGFFVFGLTLVWAFGREYGDGTAKDLLALPTPRGTVVGAKVAVTALWSVALSVLMLAIGLVIGLAVDIPGWSADLTMRAVARMAVALLLSVVLVWPFAFVTSAGRGYLPPFGCMLLALLVTQIVSVLGWGAYFPWAVPTLYATAGGASGTAPGMAGFLVAILTGLVGLVGTIAWWRRADQT